MRDQTSHKPRPAVEVVSSRYQPSKAELNEDMRVGGAARPFTVDSLADAARLMTRPVRIRETRKPD